MAGGLFIDKLNLLIPKDVDNPPLLVWIGGGAWSKVSRQVEIELAWKLAEYGTAVAALGHRRNAAAGISKVQSVNLFNYGHGDLWRHFPMRIIASIVNWW